MDQHLVYINSATTYLRLEQLLQLHSKESDKYVPLVSSSARLQLKQPHLTSVSDTDAIIFKSHVSKKVLVLCPIEDFSTAFQDLRHLENKGFQLFILSKLDSLIMKGSSTWFERSFSTRTLIQYPAIEPSYENSFRDKKILITGAAGSIGSALSLKLSQEGCKELIVMDHSERLMFKLSQQLKPYEQNQPISYVVADIVDKVRVNQLFEHHQPDQVFHLAAYKHVGLMEMDPYAAFKTNVLGTKVLFDSALKHEVKRFSFISTDKAVEPICIMGMTKKIAEYYLMNSSSASINAHILRFGNVLGSSGSVVERFQQSLAQHQALEINHPKMDRYFVLIEDLISFIITASALAEQNNTMVFKINEPTSIYDLAKALVHLSGREESTESCITFNTGNAFEKLSETLIAPDEMVSDTGVPYIKRISSDVSWPNIHEIINELEQRFISPNHHLKVKDFETLLKNKGLALN